MNLKRIIGGLAWTVWRRDADVYMVTWKTNVLPPLLEPFLFLAAFGAGLGSLINTVDWRGQPYTYASFIAPGLIAAGVMNQTFFENTFSTFVRLHYQKTFDALLATPLTAGDIILGELLWGATKGFFTGIVMLLVITGFGLMHYPTALGIIPYCFLNGLMFAGLALCFTGRTTRIEAFNFPMYLLVSPMYVLSGTFFPLEILPHWGQAIAWALPLTHAAAATREMALGRVTQGLAVSVAYTIAVTGVSCWLGFRWMKRRLFR